MQYSRKLLLRKSHQLSIILISDCLISFVLLNQLHLWFTSFWLSCQKALSLGIMNLFLRYKANWKRFRLHPLITTWPFRLKIKYKECTLICETSTFGNIETFSLLSLTLIIFHLQFIWNSLISTPWNAQQS